MLQAAVVPFCGFEMMPMYSKAGTLLPASIILMNRVSSLVHVPAKCVSSRGTLTDPTDMTVHLGACSAFLPVHRKRFAHQALPGNAVYVNQYVNYSKKSKGKANKKSAKDEDNSGTATDDDSEDDDDFDHDEDIEIDEGKKDWKDLKMNVPSTRIDAVLSAGLGLSRKKIEDAFLGAKLRHNGKKVMKKSRQVLEGDVLDMLKDNKAVPKDGEQVMSVMRVEIRKIKDEKTTSEKTPVILRRWKHLDLPREK